MSHQSGRATTPEEDNLFAFAGQPGARPSDTLEETVRRVQRATELDPSSTIPTDLKHQIWENLMTSSTAAIPNSAGNPPSPALERARRDQVGFPARHALRRLHLSTAANVVLAAAIILALAVGIWRATGGFGPGNDDGQPAMQLGGPVSPAASPSGNLDPADLPTAADCTVEPLTVDDVIGSILAPYVTSSEKNGGTPITLMPATPPGPAQADAGTSGMPATQEDLDAAATTQRMWMACVLADSYFQVWALEHPDWVREQVMAVLPPLTGEAEARAILEDLRANGPGDVREDPGSFASFSSRGYPGLGGIHIVETDPGHSWMLSPQLMVTGYLRYSPEGEYLGRSTAIPETDSEQFRNLAPGTCSTFMFAWNEERQMWLVRGAPSCG